MVAYPCWQYYVFDADPDEENPETNKPLDDPVKLEKELNRIGRTGWEMCGIFPEDGIIVFKRPHDGITNLVSSKKDD